jgi:hypothetical protein
MAWFFLPKPEPFTRDWTVALEDGSHRVRLEIARGFLMLSCKVSLSVDDDVLQTRTFYWTPMLAIIDGVDYKGHVLAVRSSILGYTVGLHLLVDGNRVEPATARLGATLEGVKKDAPAERSGVAEREVQVLEETDVNEGFVVVDTEEFPLSNRDGAGALEIEHEISKTVSNEFSIRATVGGSAEISASLLSPLSAKIAAQLSKETGQVVGETITRRETIKVSVPPHAAVLYTIVWRRRSRTGRYLVSVDGARRFVPYQAYYGLSYEIKASPL